MVNVLRFQELSRRLRAAATAAGMVAPTFASLPPEAIDRSIKRVHGETPVVKVRLHGRDEDDVWADMVDGVLVANWVPNAPDEIREQLASAR